MTIREKFADLSY